MCACVCLRCQEIEKKNRRFDLSVLETWEGGGVAANESKEKSDYAKMIMMDEIIVMMMMMIIMTMMKLFGK